MVHVALGAVLGEENYIHAKRRLGCPLHHLSIGLDAEKISHKKKGSRPSSHATSSAAASSHPRSAASSHPRSAAAAGGMAPPETRFSPESGRVGAIVVFSHPCAAPLPGAFVVVWRQKKDEEAEQFVVSSSSPAALADHDPELEAIRQRRVQELMGQHGGATVQRTSLRGDVEGDDADEQVGVCKALPEPFQLFQSHKMSWKSVQGSRGTRITTVRSRLPLRGLGLPSGTSRPSSTSPSRLHQHRVPEGRRRPRRRATAAASSAARLEGGIKGLPPLPGPTCVQFLLMYLMLPNSNKLLSMLYRSGRGISVSSSDDVPI